MRASKIPQNIKTEFLRKSKKIPEVTCQIPLGRYHTRPIGLTLIRRCGSLAQLVEQLAFNQLVAGSNPARPTISKWVHTGHMGNILWLYPINGG